MVGDYGDVYLVDWGLAKIIDNNFDSITSSTYDPDKIIDPGTTQNVFKHLKNIQSLRDKIDVSISMHNVIVGTLHYMAPERFTGQADEVSEIYALGVILYNILTLDMTVHTSEVEKIIESIIDGEIKPPSNHKGHLPHLPNYRVPEALSAITIKALSPDRESRYQHIKELNSDINLWQQGFVTKAENAGLIQILWLAIKRHKAEAFMSSAFVFIIVFLYSAFVIGIEDQRNLFNISKSKAMSNRELINHRMIEIDNNSELIEEKISELKSLAGQFFDLSNKALENHDVPTALAKIDTALKLNYRKKYLLQKAFLLLLNKKFEDAERLLEEAQQQGAKSDPIRVAQELASKLKNEKTVKVKDLLQLRSIALKLNRQSDAAIYHNRIKLHNKGIFQEILKYLQNSNLNFISNKHLEIDSNGYFSLNVQNYGILDLSVLKGLPFRSITLDNNPISDLSPLAGMPLEELSINNTLVTDLTPLKDMPLVKFSALDTKIKDLAPLHTANLKELIISNTPVTSLDNINTRNIHTLLIDNTLISDLSAIKNAISLRVLSAASTSIKNLKPAKDLNISNLNISKTKITELEPLTHHPLKQLDITQTKIESLVDIKDCPLQVLKANYSNLSDLSPLKSMKLKELYVSGTQVTNLHHLRHMPLSILYIANTSISDLTPLAKCPLVTLSAQNSSINNFGPFRPKSLKYLDLSYTQIRHPPDLTNRNLDYLNLSGNKLESLEGLRHSSLTNFFLDHALVENPDTIRGVILQTLSLKFVSRKSLEVLKHCRPKNLNVIGSEFTDIEYLRELPLTTLTFNAKGISDLSPIQGKAFSNLHIVYLIQDNLDILEAMPLRKLTLLNSTFKDMSVISKLKRLTDLNLSYSKFSNLPKLPFPLKKLNISNCPDIKDYWFLKTGYNLQDLSINSSVRDYSLLEPLKNLKTLANESQEPINKLKYMTLFPQEKLNDK